MNRLLFFIDNIVSKFDELGLTVAWRIDKTTTIDNAKLSTLLLSQKKIEDKITLINAVIDVWKTSQLLEYATNSDLIEISKIDFSKVDQLFDVLKGDLKKMLVEVTKDDVYEIDMVKLDKFRNRLSKLKIKRIV